MGCCASAELKRQVEQLEKSKLEAENHAASLDEQLKLEVGNREKTKSEADQRASAAERASKDAEQRFLKSDRSCQALTQVVTSRMEKASRRGQQVLDTPCSAKELQEAANDLAEVLQDVETFSLPELSEPKQQAEGTLHRLIKHKPDGSEEEDPEEHLRGLMRASYFKVQQLLQNEERTRREMEENIRALEAILVHAKLMGLVQKHDSQTLGVQRLLENLTIDMHRKFHHAAHDDVGLGGDDVPSDGQARVDRHGGILEAFIENEDQLRKFAEHCRTDWRKNHCTTALDCLAEALLPCADSRNERRSKLHTIWEKAQRSASAHFGDNGVMFLLSKVYTMEAQDVNNLVGSTQNSQKIAPYKVMNAAARLISGAQHENGHWPKNREEAEEAFGIWSKVTMALSAAAVDLASEEVRNSLIELSETVDITKALASLEVGAGAVPDALKTEGVHALSGPCLYCGISVPEEVYKTYSRRQEGEPFYFGDLRSTSLSPDVAFSFLNLSASPYKVLVLMEGVQRGLPLWHQSKYPKEIEVLLPSCSKFKLACDPKVVNLPGYSGVLLVHLQYVGLGLDESFLELVRGYSNLDDHVLTSMTHMKEREEELKLQLKKENEDEFQKAKDLYEKEHHEALENEKVKLVEELQQKQRKLEEDMMIKQAAETEEEQEARQEKEFALLRALEEGADLRTLRHVMEQAEKARVDASTLEQGREKLEELRRQSDMKFADMYASDVMGKSTGFTGCRPSLLRAQSDNPAVLKWLEQDAEIDFCRYVDVEEVIDDELHTQSGLAAPGLDMERRDRYLSNHKDVLNQLKQAFGQLGNVAGSSEERDREEAATDDSEAEDGDEGAAGSAVHGVQPVEVNIKIRKHIASMDKGASGPMVGEPAGTGGRLTYVELPPQIKQKHERLAQEALFHRVTDGTTSQEQFFQTATVPVLDKVLEGFNATFLAYGQSGSGKSYTMIGDSSLDGQGVIPRSLEYLASRMPAGAKVRLAILEFYRHKVSNTWCDVKDLLVPCGKCKVHQYEKQAQRAGGAIMSNVSGLGIKDMPTGPDLKHSTLELLKLACKRRATRAQKLNDESSRGHLAVLFELTAEGRTSLLYFLDLAGSEKVKKSGVTGEGADEAKEINLSLFYLRALVSQLAEGKKATGWRDHALCTFLKPFVGGSAFLHLVCTLRPDGENMMETLDTLRFAMNAMAVKNKPKRNDKGMTLEAVLNMLNAEKDKNKQLKRELKQLRQEMQGSLPERGIDPESLKAMEAALNSYEELLAEEQGFVKPGDFAGIAEEVLPGQVDEAQIDADDLSPSNIPR